MARGSGAARGVAVRGGRGAAEPFGGGGAPRARDLCHVRRCCGLLLRFLLRCCGTQRTRRVPRCSLVKRQCGAAAAAPAETAGHKLRVAHPNAAEKVFLDSYDWGPPIGAFRLA
jgi:hypothetical protein